MRHRRYQGGEIGVALLSRYPLETVERIATAGSRLGALDAIVRAPLGALRVTVVHFHPTDPRDDAKQRAATDSLRLREATTALEAAGSDLPRIIVGDFNARPSGPEYERYAAKLTDACPGRATWPAELPVMNIDYVWLSRTLRAFECPPIASVASDHLPVLAVVQRSH